MQRLILCIVLVFLMLVVGALSAQDSALDVVATTTIVADVARQVGGEWVNIVALVPPDADAHAYQLLPSDVEAVASANVLLAVGAGYESFLGGLLENAGGVQAVVVSEGVPVLPFGETDVVLREDGTLGLLGDEILCEGDHEAEHADENGHEHGVCDPHVWMDPENVIIWTQNIADAFSAADPAHAADYRINCEAYVERLRALDTELEAMVEPLPVERRVLVTNHEFMGYFAHAYGFEIVGTVISGLSTSAEPTPQELAAIIEQIEAARVPAVFAEMSANSQLAETVAQEAGVNVVTTLYSESLSDADGPASTYLDFMRYDTETVVEALGEEQS
jgi:ABC-type Zn uptake system ZnuABC Zn-binding protein ZnuA